MCHQCHSSPHPNRASRQLHGSAAIAIQPRTGGRHTQQHKICLRGRYAHHVHHAHHAHHALHMACSVIIHMCLPCIHQMVLVCFDCPYIDITLRHALSSLPPPPINTQPFPNIHIRQRQHQSLCHCTRQAHRSLPWPPRCTACC